MLCYNTWNYSLSMKLMKINIKKVAQLSFLVVLSFTSTVYGQEGFDAFISTSVNNTETITPVSETGSSFGSFINTSTTSTTSGISLPTRPIATSTFTSTESNVGGSIYVPYDGPVFTGPGLEGGALLAENLLDDNVSKERDLKELVIGWMNFLLSLAALLAVIAIVWAGFLYVTAAGDDGRMETAKKIVIWVVIGILLILAAYAIVNTVMQAAF